MLKEVFYVSLVFNTLESTIIIPDIKEIIFEFGASYIEIAELLGTSYRHLRRTLNKFCEDNILENKNKKYVVKNLKNLKELSSDLYKM